MQNRVALVMGGGAGTGRATVLAFVREAAAVVIADVNEKTGRETLTLIEAQGGKGHFVHADIGSAADMQRVIAETHQTFGGPCTWSPIMRRSAHRTSRSPSSVNRSGTAVWRSRCAVCGCA